MLSDIELGQRIANRAYAWSQQMLEKYVAAVVMADRRKMMVYRAAYRLFYADYLSTLAWLDYLQQAPGRPEAAA